MSSSCADLIRAIKTGRLAEVIAALDDGAPVEFDDGRGDPGLPLAIACFMGHAEIVRELILRGAKPNFPDNTLPSSPLAIALRCEKSDVVKVLIEHGAEVPAGVHTGLSAQELTVARWKAQHFAAQLAQAEGKKPVIEEIEMVGCYGTDTNVLEAEVVRAALAMEEKKNSR